MGISFAIPIDEAMRVADQLKTTGKVTRGRIAVAIGEVTKDVADSLGLPKAQGALVSSVESGGPADRAGVQPGDIILKFNGTNVETATDLPRMVGDSKPGAKATITIWRKGQQRELPITIAEMQPDKVAKTEQRKAPQPKERASNSLGIAVSDIGGARGVPEGRHHHAHRRYGHHEREAVRIRRAGARREQDGRGSRAPGRQHAVRAVAPPRACAEVASGR
jgi:membrane-associated protease RseP (regulator of RpoE activity)